MDSDKEIVLFQEKKIRRLWHNDEWFFSVVDVVEVLTDSPLPRQYWSKVKKELTQDSQTYPFWIQLKLTAQDGRNRLTDCANTEGVLRIVMSVPSPKAEPLKQWMAQVSKERIDEVENPELGIERIREIYRLKGYSTEWIDTRIKSIDIRKQLTNEWKKRGVQEGQEFSILTSEIAKATFGLTPSEYKNLKSLDTQNLRDHMTNLELIFTMLGEESSRMYAIKDNATGFEENRESALKGGNAAGTARKAFEKKTNEKVVSSENFTNQINNAIQPKDAIDSKSDKDV